MDDTLRLIQHLYDEDVDDPAFEQRLQTDEALRREYEALQDTKAALDRRASPSPDAGVVDAVVQRARDAAGSDESASTASDRPARQPERGTRRRLQSASAVLAILLVAGIGWWQLRAPESTPAGTTASAPGTQQPTPAVDGAEARSAADMPEWDDRDEVVRLHRRIEMLRTQSRSDAWEGSSLQPIDRTGP